MTLSFANQLTLLKDQPSEPGWIFDADAHLGEPLDLDELRICQLTILTSRLKRAEARCCDSLRSWKGCTQSERRLTIRIFQNAGQLGENFVTQGSKLVLSLRTLHEVLST